MAKVKATVLELIVQFVLVGIPLNTPPVTSAAAAFCGVKEQPLGGTIEPLKVIVAITEETDGAVPVVTVMFPDKLVPEIVGVPGEVPAPAPLVIVGTPRLLEVRGLK